jgi:hypothetical protein
MLELNNTLHLNHFKKLIGQANHLLITILIGIEGVRTGQVTKSDDFNVSWNPKSIEDSSVRSRIFARNSALSWVMDSLDSYLGFLRKNPFVFPEPFNTEFKNERFLFRSFNRIIEFTSYDIDFPLCIVHLGIQWRNNLVHFHADNELEQKYIAFLRNFDKKDIEERFCGLDPIMMIEHFKNRKTPTFKEVAAIIQSVHYIVLELDKKLKEYIDVDFLIKYLIKENSDGFKQMIESNPNKRFKKVKRFFISKGLKEVESTKSKIVIDDDMIIEIIKKHEQLLE